MLHELKDISEVRQVKASRDGDPNPTRIRVVMVLNAIKLHPKPIIELTDFSKAYQSNKISLSLDPSLYPKVLEPLKSYGFRNKFNPNVLEYLDQHVVVLLKITSELYNGKLDLKYVLKDVNIINKDPTMVLNWEIKHQKKVKWLFNELCRRNINKTVQNKVEFNAIGSIISSKVTEARELEQQPQSKKQKADIELKSLPLQINPLFIAPENSHSQLSNTQIYDLPDSISETTKSYVEEKTVLKLENLDEEEEEMKIVSLSSDLESPVPIEQSTQEKPKPSLEQHLSPAPTATPSPEKNKSAPMFSDAFSDLDEEISRDKINKDPNAIANNLEGLELNPGEKLDFFGYILGIEPQDFNIIGKSYKELVKATNFRLYISNVKDLKVFKVNYNCLCLEFRSKEQILEFLGYESLDDSLKALDSISKRLQTLINNDSAYRFQVSQKIINLSNGAQKIWELQDSLDELLDSAF